MNHEITRKCLLEKVDEQESHNGTLKIASFLLEYIKLWDEKSTHYQRGCPRIAAITNLFIPGGL
jgi:hypothetical protein